MNITEYSKYDALGLAELVSRKQVSPKELAETAACTMEASFRSGWLNKFLGENKFVWRGGYQISYVPLEALVLTLMLANSPPNAISADTHAKAGPTGRGLPH
jgi:hypothetical protein